MMRLKASGGWLRLIVLACVTALTPGEAPVVAQQNQPSPSNAESDEPQKLPPDQLDSLVAPIALYPDPLLAQTLAASTYPLEIVQLKQWLDKHKNLKDKALADAVEKQGWDPSVQAMAALPQVVATLADNIKWTSELGNAFLAQQSDVMDAVQRMRAKAKDTGKLKSNNQMKVETKTVESKNVIVIEQPNPQVVYVPSYDPAVVWGASPFYPYPPYYPPPGYYAAGMAISFGVGVALGAAWGGGWGWNCGWGGNNNININNNNNFIRNSNRTNAGNRVGGNNNTWRHNPQHRGGAPYGDRATAAKYGGNARGDSLASRQASARQNAGRTGAGQSGRGQVGGGQLGSGNRSLSGGSGAPGANRTGGGDRIGNRQVSNTPGSRGGSGFGDVGGRNGGATRAASQRGASSFGGGGSFSRGGGFGGGGARGGGGFRGGGRRR